MRKTSFLILFFLCFYSITGFNQSIKTQVAEDKEWSFIFMTDIHLEYGKHAVDGFKLAIKSATHSNPDFIITGGDLVADALGQNFDRADSLYDLYNSVTSEITTPIYNTLGNHEVFGWYPESGILRTHAEFGKKMYENRIGKRYYSFMHKGWCFLIFDSVEEIAEGKGYFGNISQEQIDWLYGILKNISKETPIVISTHIPFITARTQLEDSSLAANSNGLVIGNSKKVYDIVKEYNLKMVLQGHLHIYEDLYIYNTHFITGGAISGAWWTGAHEDTEEGFLRIDINGNNFSTSYIDYGWDVSTK